MTDLMLRLGSMNSQPNVKLEAFGGTHIARACEQATKVATILGVVVHFEFNGIPCYARPNSDWRTLKRNWEALANAEARSRHDMAWSDVPAVSEGAGP